MRNVFQVFETQYHAALPRPERAPRTHNEHFFHGFDRNFTEICLFLEATMNVPSANLELPLESAKKVLKKRIRFPDSRGELA